MMQPLMPRRAAASQHGPHRRLLRLVFMAVDPREQHRQHGANHNGGHPRHHVQQLGRGHAQQQLAGHRTKVINDHIGRQQLAAVAQVAAAQQRALHDHPDPGAADAGEEAPAQPAPKIDRQHHAGSRGGEHQTRKMIAAGKTDALDQFARHQRAQQVAAEIRGTDHSHLPGRQLSMG